MANTPVRISQLNNYIGKLLSSDIVLSEVDVIGEISNLTFHTSGHIYFSLKDEKSKISCFLASQNSKQIPYDIENGMEIVATGFVKVFEKGGYYSLNIVDLKPSGEGDLNLAFQKLKEKLEGEGLFRREIKKPLPEFPKKIMIITSPTGAAVQDIQKIILEKNDYVDIYILPAIVQGDRAAKDIAKAVEEANAKFPDVDIIILGRGGGSKEDLWAFNEEILVKAIYNSKIPIISAVGHETDITLSDLAADVRAETPTAAADLAVPSIKEIWKNLEENKEKIVRYLKEKTAIKESELKRLDIENLRKNILRKLENQEKEIKSLKSNREDRYSLKIKYLEQLLLKKKNILEQRSPKENLNNKIWELRENNRECTRRFESQIKKRENSLAEMEISLKTLNPQNILDRGYSMLMDEANIPLNSIKNVKINDKLKVLVKDGTLNVNILSVEENKER